MGALDVVLDIECIPIPPSNVKIEKLRTAAVAAFQAKQEEKKAGYKPPKTWKDPIKIEEHKRKFDASLLQDAEEFEATVGQQVLNDFMEKHRFKAPYNQVISVALCANPYDSPKDMEITTILDPDPRNLIEQFVKAIDDLGCQVRLVGWNIKGYDFPILLKYMMKYEVYPVKYLDRYGILDLCDAPFRGTALKDLSESIGLELQDVDGSNVEELYKTGAFDKIKEYNADDVVKTSIMLQRISRVQRL